MGNVTYVKIPNIEVKEELIKIVEEINYKDPLQTDQKYREFLMSFLEGKKETIENFINEQLPSMSYYDTYEVFYHGYMLGLFSGFLNKNFIVKSNREAGKGRYDISIESINKKYGVVIEIKIVEDENILE